MTTDGQVVVCDMEAGVRTLMRMPAHRLEVLVVVAEPTAKSIEVARRAQDVGKTAARRIAVVANRVRNNEELEAIRAGLGVPDLHIIPDDPAISRADRAGQAAIDAAPYSPGVRAIVELASQLVVDARRP